MILPMQATRLKQIKSQRRKPKMWLARWFLSSVGTVTRMCTQAAISTQAKEFTYSDSIILIRSGGRRLCITESTTPVRFITHIIKPGHKSAHTTALIGLKVNTPTQTLQCVAEIMLILLRKRQTCTQILLCIIHSYDL